MLAHRNKSADRHVAPLGHIILIPNQPVFVLSPYCCVLSGKATNTNFIVFSLTRSGLEPMIYCTQGEHTNHHIADMGQNCGKYILMDMGKTYHTLMPISGGVKMFAQYFRNLPIFTFFNPKSSSKPIWPMTSVDDNQADRSMVMF